MIRGAFLAMGTRSRPFVDAVLAFPEQRAAFQVNLLVDTGADRTVLGPLDARRLARRLGMDVRTLPDGDPSTGVGGRMGTRALARRAHADALDALLGQATRRWERYELMARLPEAGVPAGVVQNGEDLLERDPQLRERGFSVRTDHPELGAFAVQGTPPRFSHTPARVRHGAPTLGQHGDAIYGELLGLSAEEMEGLRQRGIIAHSEESGRPRQLPAWVTPRT